MSAPVLFACSRCFSRHPFEELSAGQQLCKVSGFMNFLTEILVFISILCMEIVFFIYIVLFMSQMNTTVKIENRLDVKMVVASFECLL